MVLTKYTLTLLKGEAKWPYLNFGLLFMIACGEAGPAGEKGEPGDVGPQGKMVLMEKMVLMDRWKMVPMEKRFRWNFCIDINIRRTCWRQL